MKPDVITHETFVLGGFSKWRDRSSDKQGIEDYNLLISTAQFGITGLCYWSHN